MTQRKEIRLTLFATFLSIELGCITALIAGKGSLEIESVLYLGILGWLSVCVALWICGWFKAPVQAVLCLFSLILTFVACWFAWPNPLEGTARFSFMVPYDAAQGHQPIPLDENPDDPLHETYVELASLAYNGTVSSCVADEMHPGQFKCKTESVSTAEAPDFLSRLLQFYLLEAIDGLERDTLITKLGYPAGSQAGINTPDRAEYPSEKLAPQLGGNKFYRPYMNMPPPLGNMPPQLRSVVVPKGTKVSLEKVMTRAGSTGYVLRLKRPRYFDLEFEVENFVGTGVGSTPKQFATPYAATTMQWPFFTTMSYVIQRRSWSGFRPQLYAQWANDLFAGLQRKFNESR